METTDFSQALEGDVPETRNGKESGDKSADDRGLKDVAQRNPIEEAQKSFERGFDEGRGVSGIENFGAEAED